MTSCLRRPPNGFTLIELMVAVAIVAVLAAVAIPSYQEYLRRAAAVEVILAGRHCVTSVIGYYATNGVWPRDSAAAGCDDAHSHYVASVDVTEGVIAVNARNIPGVSGAYILESLDEGWSCLNSTLPKKYLPSNCR